MRSWNLSNCRIQGGFRAVPGWQPSGAIEDFLSGFISIQEAAKFYGRPWDGSVTDGSYLVADDGAAKFGGQPKK